MRAGSYDSHNVVESNPDFTQFMRLVVRSYSSATQPVVATLDARGGMVNVTIPRIGFHMFI